MSPRRPDRDDMSAAIGAFLESTRFAVVGASRQTFKYGFKVLEAYLEHGLEADPVNPHEREILGRRCYPSLKDLPTPAEAVSIVTPPEVTEKVIEEAAAAGARHVWMQPGAESGRAIERARKLGLSVIAGGPCVLVELAARGRR